MVLSLEDGNATTRFHQRNFCARGQRPAMPVVGFIRDGSADGSGRFVDAFRKGLNEIGYIEGQNVTVESVRSPISTDGRCGTPSGCARANIERVVIFLSRLKRNRHVVITL